MKADNTSHRPKIDTTLFMKRFKDSIRLCASFVAIHSNFHLKTASSSLLARLPDSEKGVHHSHVPVLH